MDKPRDFEGDGIAGGLDLYRSVWRGGQVVYQFANLWTGRNAILGATAAIPGKDDLNSFAQAIGAAALPDLKFGDWTQTDKFNVLKSSAVSAATGIPDTMYVTRVGRTFWRFDYSDHADRTAHEIIEPALTDALLQTIDDIAIRTGEDYSRSIARGYADMMQRTASDDPRRS